MSIPIYHTAIEHEIKRVLSEPPSEQNVLLLAALYTIEDKFISMQLSSIKSLTDEPKRLFGIFISIIRTNLSLVDKYIELSESVIAKTQLTHINHMIERAKQKAETQDDISVINDVQLQHDIINSGVE